MSPLEFSPQTHLLEFSINENLSHWETYQKAHCYQYDIRIKNRERDLKDAGLTEDQAAELRVSDFDFQYVSKEKRERCREVQAFIERHEWLGRMPHRPTHRFTATYQGRWAGVVVMATPNAFSNLLGRENQNLEKLIARGACISWSPKNVGSALVMFAIRWMVKNTEFRFFTAYSDTEARELGTIYQACNFVYLGTSFGSRQEYFDPKSPERGWFSDRLFRRSAQYRRYAGQLGIPWQREWGDRTKIIWEKIPEQVEFQLRAQAKEAESQCQSRSVPPKHKYVYVLGQSKSETKKLKAKLFELNPKLDGLAYPKIRGSVPSKRIEAVPGEPSTRPVNLPEAAKIPAARPLLDTSTPCRPRGPATDVRVRSVLSIQQVAARYGVSDWTLYRLIKTDPSFPYLNIGLKKKFVVDEEKLKAWMEERTHREQRQAFHIPTGQELLTKGRSA